MGAGLFDFDQGWCFLDDNLEDLDRNFLDDDTIDGDLDVDDALDYLLHLHLADDDLLDDPLHLHLAVLVNDLRGDRRLDSAMLACMTVKKCDDRIKMGWSRFRPCRLERALPSRQLFRLQLEFP